VWSLRTCSSGPGAHHRCSRSVTGMTLSWRSTR
jgi:hypothetical protein